MTDSFPILLAVLLMVVIFVRAMNHGVVRFLTSGCAALAALVAAYAGLELFPALGQADPETDLSWKFVMGLTGASALAAYFLTFYLAGWILKRIIGPDSALHWMADGFPGGILSLFPAAVVVFFLFFCFRVSGTILELNYVASLSRDGIESMGGRIPDYPIAGTWRDSIEEMPFVEEALDLVDPLSRRGSRNAAAFVVMSQSLPIRHFIQTQPEAAHLVEAPVINETARDPNVQEVIHSQKRVQLLLHPKIQALGNESELAPDFRELRLAPVLKRFVDSLEPVVPATPEAPAPAL